MLADKFVSDPRDVVKAGDVVKVKVVEVDVARKRIALTMRLDDDKPTEKRDFRQPEKQRSGRGQQPSNSAMADAFAKLKR